MAAQSGCKFSEWWRVGGKLRYFGQLYFSFGSVVLKAAAASRKPFWGLKAYGQLSGVGSTWLTPAAQQSGGTEPPTPHSSDCPPTPFTNGFSWKANHQANKIQTFPGTVMMKQLVGWVQFQLKALPTMLICTNLHILPDLLCGYDDKAIRLPFKCCSKAADLKAIIIPRRKVFH